MRAENRRGNWGQRKGGQRKGGRVERNRDDLRVKGTHRHMDTLVIQHAEERSRERERDRESWRDKERDTTREKERQRATRTKISGNCREFLSLPGISVFFEGEYTEEILYIYSMTLFIRERALFIFK